MNEFLKLSWRPKDLSEIEPQTSFIKDDVVAESLVYKYIQKKTLFFEEGGHKKPKKIFQEKPYVPGGHIKLTTIRKSHLDEWAQEQCLKALKVFQLGKDPSCYTSSEQFVVDIFKKLKPKIIDENAKYEAHILNEWNKIDIAFSTKIKGGIYIFGKKVWEKKWQKIVQNPQHYKEILTFNMHFNEEESIIDYKCIHVALELGTLARFSYPNLKSPCFLKAVTLPDPEESRCVYSNLPVSQDQNIDKILQTHNISIVISASSLKCITDTSDPKSRWMIPVVIKEVQKDNGGTQKVVFLNKPFSQNVMSTLDFTNIGFKRLIKTNFCQHEAFDYGTNDSTPTLEKDDDYKSAFDSGNFFSQPRNRHNNKIHHNASYRIWNIKKTDCQNNMMKNRSKHVEFNVLIRSKLDACEVNEQGALQPVIIRPKLERQLKYGANVPSKSELAREWTSLFFTPFSNLYRVRICPRQGEVICLEKCNIQKVVAEAQTHYQYKPQFGLGILQKVFEELINLKPGKYLLQHLPKHEAFLAVLQECDPRLSNQGEIFDFHAEYDKVTVEHVPRQWLPIDVNFILPSFEAVNRMPGMFTPRIDEKKKKKFKKKKKGNKTIAKNKSEEKAKNTK